MNFVAGAHVTPNVRLVRPLGQGGMGEVWVAEHLALGTEVAVKFLHGDYASNESARARFSQEAAAAARVKSSHVVKIYDYGLTDTQTPFIVMELLEGTDLSKRIETSGPVPPKDVVAIVSQLVKALERAHEKGVVHRDIKPENIFLGSEGSELFVKLLDFGIAKTDAPENMVIGARKSTLAGETLGTPYYMSPEQFRSSKTIDFRTDLWSVGVVVYEALTGTLPFVAETTSALAILVNEAVTLGPSNYDPSLPKELDAWFQKACARDPQDRFQSARELGDALRVALGESPLPSAGRLEAASSPGASGRQPMISAADAAEIEQLSLRETAFASTGAGSRAGPVPRRGLAGPLLAGLGLVLILGRGAVVAWRSASSNASVTAAAATPTLQASAAPQGTTSSAAAVAPAPSDVPTTKTPAATMSATTTARPTAAHPVAPTTSSSAAPKGSTHERDIW